MSIYNWIVIIAFVVLFGWCVIINNQYDILQKDYELLKENKEFIIDSLSKENLKTKQEITILEDSLKTIDVAIIDNSIKIEEIKKDEFIISTSLSESADLLKRNLLCTEL